jgi:hypothetical protein
MTDLEMDSAGDYIGQCPNEPEDPISFEAYERVIAAMEKMCAEAPPVAQDSPPGAAEPQDAPPPPQHPEGDTEAEKGLGESK